MPTWISGLSLFSVSAHLLFMRRTLWNSTLKKLKHTTTQQAWSLVDLSVQDLQSMHEFVSYNPLHDPTVVYVIGPSNISLPSMMLRYSIRLHPSTNQKDIVRGLFCRNQLPTAIRLMIWQYSRTQNMQIRDNILLLPCPSHRYYLPNLCDRYLRGDREIYPTN